MKKLCLAFLMLGLAIVGGTRLGLAQDLQEKASDDTIASMLRDGWKIKQNGVLQRDRGPHQTETFVFGSAGFTWKLQDLQNQLRRLRLVYQRDPKPELRKAILNHRKEIANTQKMIALSRASEDSGETTIDKVSCNISFGYSATASNLTSQQGVTANASANFSSNCSFTGEVYAYSISEATVNGALTTQTLTDGPRSGSSVTASANTSQTGLPSCDSYSYASMTSSDFSYEKSSYSISASNYSCPAPVTPLTITFAVSPTSSSASPIQLNGSGCATVTWTATPAGGTTPRTTTIYVNGTSVATGNSYSKSYCNTGTALLQTIPAYAVVTDSSGTSKTSATVNTYIQNHAVNPVPTITGPSYVYAYSGGGCVTSTWTASTTGGTSPYTYQWTWNGTAVGTGATYSRSTCAGMAYSDTFNTLGLTATDSASHAGTASLTVEVEKAGSGGACLVAAPDGKITTQPCN